MKSKFTAACLAILMVATWFTVGCSMTDHSEKHTGAVTVQLKYNAATYQLLRPDAELFVMDMATNPPPLYVNEGDSFSDITYYDNGAKRVFVKANGYKPAPPKPTDETVHYSYIMTTFCTAGGSGNGSIVCSAPVGSGNGSIVYSAPVVDSAPTACPAPAKKGKKKEAK